MLSLSGIRGIFRRVLPNQGVLEVIKIYRLFIPFLLVATSGVLGALQPVEHQNVGSAGASRRIAVVSEWSRYKASLIEALTEELDDGETSIAVRSFDDFSNLDARDFDAVIVINAGVGSEVRRPVVDWLNRQDSDDNIVVLTTQISNWTPQIEVDSVTSASRNRNIPEVSRELVEIARSYYR